MATSLAPGKCNKSWIKLIGGVEGKKRNEASGWMFFKNLRCNFDTSSRISNASNIDLHQCLGFKGLEIFSFRFRTSFKAWNVFLMTCAFQRTQIRVRTTRRTGEIWTWTWNLPKIHPERPFDMRISKCYLHCQISKKWTAAMLFLKALIAKSEKKNATATW